MDGNSSMPISLDLNSEASCDIESVSPQKRCQEAIQRRKEAALFEKSIPLPEQHCNCDECLFPTKIANYSKALPHDQLAQVDLCAYQAMINALTTGDPEKFEIIPLGGTVKLSDPQAAYAFEMAGPDSHHLGMIAPPDFSSACLASEMAELYWQSLCRDVPFSEYDTNALIQAAATDLTSFSCFRGPKIDKKVTPKTLFRLDVPGDLRGPYMSQFLWKDIPFGATTITQRYRTPVAGIDFMTEYAEWLNIQNGLVPTNALQYSAEPHYIYNGRALGEYVHRDFSFQAVLNACLILLSFGTEVLALSNPYLHSATQIGFATFGSPHILDFVVRSARVALEAAWFQKFLVHRRLRPEEFGGCVQNRQTGAADYPINPELLNSPVVMDVFNKYGTYLLPQAYPEGCPTHPAYPSGHATIAGAGVTILKAFFKECFVLPAPVVASSDGVTLLPYSGSPLTVGEELNKLAVNIAMGRNFAGIHWRTDNSAGMKLGETVAIRILQDYRNTYNEDFSGFVITKFDGTTVII
jgi:hypothetical protein